MVQLRGRESPKEDVLKKKKKKQDCRYLNLSENMCG
jgi:hypothetical protein